MVIAAGWGWGGGVGFKSMVMNKAITTVGFQNWRCCCNTCLADSPLGVGGRSARQRPDIYLDERGTHLSFLSSSSLRPEPSGARALAPSSPPSVDLPTPATKPRFLAQEPSSAPPPPSQTPSPASPRPESPNHRRSPLEVLEACSTVDPPLRSSSA